MTETKELLVSEDSIMDKKLYRKTFWRSFPLQACFFYERMQNVGFAYQMSPALKKLYPEKKEASEALTRHLAIFNTTPAIVTFITGVAIAMEEKFKKARDRGEDADAESINAVKTSLMGPLAGIGDSFFWGTFRIIAAGIGASLAAQGSPLGVILFLLLYNVPHILVRWYGLGIGYRSGFRFLAGIHEGGIIAKLSEAAKIMGLIVVGSMAGSMISLALKAVATIGGAEIVLQDIFDGILPGLLPLLLTFVTYWLLKKGAKTTWVLWGMIALGILGSILGIF